MKDHSEATRSRIFTYHDEGYSERDIEKLTGVPKSYVHNILSRRAAENEYQREKGAGRKKVLSKRKADEITSISEDNSKLNSREIRNKYSKNHDFSPSRSTILKILADDGISCRTARKRPKLT